MTEKVNCKKCNDSGWVCEEHIDKPFEHRHKIGWFFVNIQGCGGAGIPCTCNTYNPPWRYPDKTRTEV